MQFLRKASLLLTILLTGCATTTPVQRLTESESNFGRNPTLMSHREIPADQIYRIYERAATGFVSIAALRESAEQRAQQFCERQGKGMLVLGEQTSKPPYILGNFPRIEIVFAAVERSDSRDGER